MTTPRPWPEGTYPPDSATWLHWFLEQDRDDQLMLAASILAAQQTAAACWQEDHATIVARLTWLQRRTIEDLEPYLAEGGIDPALVLMANTAATEDDRIRATLEIERLLVRRGLIPAAPPARPAPLPDPVVPTS